MKTTMKRLTALLVALLLCVGVVSAATTLPSGWSTTKPSGSVVSVYGSTTTYGGESQAIKSGPLYKSKWYYQVSDKKNTNNQSFRIPAVSDLFEINDGWELAYVAVAANSSGNRQPGASFLLSSSGGSMVYYFEQKATPKPTEAPVTEKPTEKPTEVPPTEKPTEKPTEVPPTEKPTEKPTEVPPTEKPTEEPTAAPTEEPTAAPTEEPTVAPTAEPTATPTAAPTVAPTKKPGNTDIPKTSDRTYPVQMALLLGGAFCLLIAAGTGIKSRKLRKNK